ncbi:MAG: hypothetical protein JWQ25_1408 [Daejeonella sp.]|nr:hypothetical protein [Daejeonella sp.]
MKKRSFLFVLLYSYFSLTFVSAQSANNETNLIGYFDGRTPCQELAKQLNEVTIPECIKIKWRLTLYKNGDDTTSGTYSLEGFKFRGDNILKGTWQITKGTKADPNAIVYQLSHSVKGALFFFKADEDVLFFLDKDRNIMVGNKNFSYALYKMIED